MKKLLLDEICRPQPMVILLQDAENFDIIVKTLFGFESILAKELSKLGASDVREGVRMVSCKGDNGFIHKANLCLRTGLKVLRLIAKFPCKNDTDLYRGILRINWSEYFDSDKTIGVDATLQLYQFSKFYVRSPQS